MTMTYLACAFSVLVGMYSMPFSLAMIKHNYKMTDFTFMEKIQNIIVLLLFNPLAKELDFNTTSKLRWALI